MANVLFSRTDSPNTKPITDGQIIFDTSGNGKMYLDNGTTRLEMGGAINVDATLDATSTNPIQNKGVAGVMLSELEEVRGTTKKGFLTDALATKTLDAKIGTTDISSVGDGTVTGAISDINGKLNITNNVFGINTSIGISFVSANCSVCVNNVYYIDAFVQLTETVPENGTLFYVVKNDNAITFNRRLDAIILNTIDGKIYQIVLLKDSNVFIATGRSIPSGFYKVTMIISI